MGVSTFFTCSKSIGRKCLLSELILHIAVIIQRAFTVVIETLLGNVGDSLCVRFTRALHACNDFIVQAYLYNFELII